MPSQPLPAILIVLSIPALAVADGPLFERDIRPVFREHCLDCHGAQETVEANLDLRLVRSMRKGGDSGPAVVAGNADGSLLFQRVRDGEMPPNGHRLSDEQITLLSRWLDNGAETARPEPASIGPGIPLTEEERQYWAYRPIVRPPVPGVVDSERVRTPIDAFLLARMEPANLAFAPEADKATLLRRAYLDLIGLPPSPEQVEQFLSDGDDDAWESIIDRLLASPQYGERWGRHWLDVAGYADSEGASNDDPVRPWAYKYRDWVIRAIDNDMPFDQFITWQLAGDELAERPYKNMSPRQIDQLTATGFLRMAADGTASKNDEEARNQVVTDTLKIIGSSLLGASVHCAQCHDHRYDPISQLDYFRLRAIFEPAFDCVNWLPPTARRVSLYRDEDIAKSQAIEEEAQVKVQERNAKQEEYMGAALQKELDKFATPLREQLAQAYATASDQRTDEQNRLLEEHPNIGKLHPGVLYQYNQEAADKLKKLDEEIAAIRSKKPAEEFLRVLTEPGEATALPVTKLFYRGDFRQPRQAVRPGGIAVASPTESFFSIADNDPSLATSGRRLAFARWLTSGRHPILARVLVNRIWLHHFGRTFVSTPDEFGKLGTSPTHPELIDWLADEFMANGWSLKRLHRLIMSSTVYRQSSLASERAQASDAANELYSHFPTHRLDAEIIRDSILCVSGRLDDTMYGPPVAVTADDTGQIVIEGDRQRRSVYLQVRRTQPIALLQSFDAPVMETNCGKRECSTVATQSLMLMNSQFVMQFSRAFADRVAARPAPSEAAGGRNSDSGTPTHTTLVDDTVMSYAWQLAYARQPTEAELARSRNFVQQHLRLLQAKQVESPEQQALSDYCQSLIMSNEFLYMH